MIPTDPNPSITAYRSRRGKRLTQVRRKFLLSLSGFFILAFGMLSGLVLIKKNTELRRQAATGDTVTLRIDTTTMTSAPGATVSVPIDLLTNIPIQGFEAYFTLSGTIPSDFTFTIDPGLDIKNNFVTYLDTNSSPAPFNLGAMFLPGTYSTNNQYIRLGTLDFTTPQSGNFKLEINDQTSGYIDPTNQADTQPLNPHVPPFQISFIAPSSPSPSPSPYPTPSPTPSLSPPTNSSITQFTLLATIAGVSSEALSVQIPVTIQLGQVGQSNPLFTKTISFTSSDNSTNFIGHLTGLHYPDLTPSGHYWISLKGEKHTQRIFADLTLNQDVQLNLTAKPLEPGDIPTQDGKVDNNDIDQLLSIFSKSTIGNSDLVADLNYDGVINSIDMGLILKTLSSKPDELPN